MTSKKKMESEKKETVFLLTRADRDRIDAALGLCRLVLKEIISTRRTRISMAVHTPVALYELEREFEKIKEEQLKFNL